MDFIIISLVFTVAGTAIAARIGSETETNTQRERRRLNDWRRAA